MKLFPFGHATHPQWQMAAGLVLAQLRAQMALPGYAKAPTLGLLYITDHYARSAQDILDHLGAELAEVTDWSGTVGVGIASSNVEYFDEPALAVMLCALPPEQYRVFSGVAPLAVGDGMGFEAHTALVHADAATPDLAELIAEMAQRTATGYLFGGLASSRSEAVQFAIGGNGNITPRSRWCYDELLPNFRSRAVNIGGDEPFELGRGVSRDQVAEHGLGRVYLDHLVRLTQPLLADGHADQVQIWADVLRRHPGRATELHEGVVPLVWCYEAPPPDGGRLQLPLQVTQLLETMGTDVDAFSGFGHCAAPLVGADVPLGRSRDVELELARGAPRQCQGEPGRRHGDGPRPGLRRLPDHRLGRQRAPPAALDQLRPHRLRGHGRVGPRCPTATSTCAPCSTGTCSTIPPAACRPRSTGSGSSGPTPASGPSTPARCTPRCSPIRRTWSSVAPTRRHAAEVARGRSTPS